MLVLSRKAGQELVLGDNVRITVTKISGNRVTLGVSAPSDVRIIRGELESIVKSFEMEMETEASDSAADEESSDTSTRRRLGHEGPLTHIVHRR